MPLLHRRGPALLRGRLGRAHRPLGALEHVLEGEMPVVLGVAAIVAQPDGHARG